jgi:cytoskeleton protein RodZ
VPSSPVQGTAPLPAVILPRDAAVPPRNAALPPSEAGRGPADATPAEAQPPAPETAPGKQAETVSPETYELKGVVLEETWVRIQIDNGGPKEYIFQPGARPQWKAKDGFYVTVGNAAGIELELNGTKLKNLGKPGKVVKLNLPASFRPARSED